jgi:hypothetical protein
VTTIDLELETWRQEWRTSTEPLPELKKKIKRQNLRMVLASVTICVCLAVSAIEAHRTRSSFLFGLAAGIAFAGVILGGYSWWVRRGAWRPAAQTTSAYLELSYKRAVAIGRTVHFSFYFLLVATVLFGGFVAWNWRSFLLRDGLILAALVIELVYFRFLGRRKQREIEETKKLMEQARE